MSKETEFTVFCMESYKVYKSLSGKQVYLFCSHGTGGLASSVELITTSYQYINRDIDIYLKSRNAVIPA